MAKILDYANDVSLGRNTRIRSAVSNSGYATTQVGSPTFYSMQVNLPPLNKAKYDEVELELLGLADGVDKLTTTIPANIAITTLKGNLNAGSDLKVRADSSNNVIRIGGFDITTMPITPAIQQLLPGDYIKFPGTKVYQIKSTLADSDNTALNVTLNQALIGANLTTGQDVDVGQSVAFQFLLNGRPSVTVIPGPGYNYYQYDTFNFREVL